MKKLTFPNRIIRLTAFFGLLLHFNSYSNSLILIKGIPIQMCDNVTSGGFIQGSETGCPDPEFDPTPITNVTLPSGGSGDLEYLWIYTEEDPNAPVTTWIPIPNSNTSDYDPGPITVETHYMRCARRSGCDEYTGESNFVTKSIECCDNVTNGGTIGVDQNICDTLFNPDPIVSSTSPNGGFGNLEYRWFQNTTGVPFDINNPDWIEIPNSNNESYDPPILSTTTFYIRCARREGCQDFVGKSNIVSIEVNQGPSIDSVLIKNVTCFGGSDGNVELLISASTGILDFRWSGGLFGLPIQRNLSAGNYSVTISDIFGCDVVENIEVTQPPEIQVATGFTTENCNFTNGGTAFATVTAGANGAVSYLWDDANVSTSDTIRNLTSNTYNVTVTDSLGCVGNGSVEVQINDVILATIQSDNPLCNDSSDGQLSVIATGGAGNYFYQWSDSNNTVGNELNGVAAGNYFVTISDADGCELVQSGTLINPSPLTLNVQTINGGCTSILGSATAIASGGTGTYSYQWNDAQMQNTQTAIDLIERAYEVTVTDQNGCSITSAFSILNNSNFSVSIQKEDLSCMAGELGSAWVVPSGGLPPYSYQWSNQSQNDTIRNLTAGNYMVTVMDSDGCERIESIDISNITPIELNIFKTDNNCIGESNGSAWIEISNGAPPYAINWSIPSQNDTISNLANGNYAVSVVDQNGCEEIRQIEISNLSNLSGNILKQDIRCFGMTNGQAEMTTSGGVGTISYSWNNGMSNSSIQNLQQGSYTVTATDELGCQFSATTNITEPSAVSCDINTIAFISTFNGLEGILEANASGGTGNLTYSWSNNSNNSEISNLEAGTYSLTVTDENGCQCNSSTRLDNPSKIEGYVWLDDNSNGIQDISENGFAGISVTLSGTNNNGQPVNITIITDATGLYHFDGLFAGDYKLTFSEPTNFALTDADVGVDDNSDSDVDPVSRMITNIMLGNSDLQTFDAGYKRENISIDIGDYVWFDTNRDGIQNSIETGVPGITVLLKDAASGNTVLTRTTDVSGRYLFTNVQPGNYYIEFSSISLLAGYIFTEQNVGNDNLDSDADENGLTNFFSVVANQNDDRSFDAGIYSECDNVVNGGTIIGNEELCGSNLDPSEITSSNLPSGGIGVLEYLWLSSNTPIYAGPGDPNWTQIPNSNSPSYDPAPIVATTYYIRCARRAGCLDYPGETNTVKKEIVSSPTANISNPPTSVCESEPTTFTAETAGAGATYSWKFSGGATPSSSSGRVINGVSWSTIGTKTIELTVTRFGCSSTDLFNLEVLSCPTPLGKFIDFDLETIENVYTKISWNTSTKDEGTFFDIEKSLDGLSFERITTINGNDDLDRGNYLFADYEVNEGMVYYKVRHYNSFGANIFSPIQQIENEFSESDAALLIYPNPANKILFVSNLKESFRSSKFMIYNTHGNLMMEQIPDFSFEKVEILVSELPDGIYLLRNNLNSDFVMKFIVQH